MSTPARDLYRRHAGDQAALDLLAIKEWAEELTALADDWLAAREAYRAPGRAGRGPRTPSTIEEEPWTG